MRPSLLNFTNFIYGMVVVAMFVFAVFGAIHLARLL